ncbi:MAG: Holliday junction resolvase RecU [Erysipelotrichaceae bacterium]|nr:Holliday junction resolvase RecU [Erysipelotrichaceae bacterium]
MIGYSNGKKPNSCPNEKTLVNKKVRTFSSANRGMSFEEDINISNDYYLSKGLMMVYKRPTPINVVKVDYSKKCARITDAYFEKQSTTDYNGVYKGKYIDFEAKSTKCKSSFPFSNISIHQINHLEKVVSNGGIAFFLIQFEALKKVYLLDAKWIIDFYKDAKRKSIPYETIKKEGIEIKQGYNPRLFYLDAIEQKYFK